MNVFEAGVKMDPAEPYPAPKQSRAGLCIRLVAAESLLHRMVKL